MTINETDRHRFAMSDDTTSSAGNQRHPVIVNVYDLNEINAYTYQIGLGIFHSGVNVHRKEWSFGGHEFSSSGCFFCEPRKVPEPARFRAQVFVGFTKKSARDVEQIVRRLGTESFRGNRYHLLLRNCNHFVEALVDELVVRSDRDGMESVGCPGWINRAARFAVVTNQFAPCVLPMSIRAVANAPLPGQFNSVEDDLDLDDDDYGGDGGNVNAVLIAPGSQRM